MGCEIDANKIAERLYQGARPPTGLCLKQLRFDMLVLAAEEYQPGSEMFPGIRVIHAPMDDSELTRDEWDTARRAAAEVASAIRVGARVLITCYAGLNRSGLITALSLYLLTGESGRAVVRVVQSRRRNALCNRSFVKALSRLPQGRRRKSS